MFMLEKYSCQLFGLGCAIYQEPITWWAPDIWQTLLSAHCRYSCLKDKYVKETSLLHCQVNKLSFGISLKVFACNLTAGLVVKLLRSRESRILCKLCDYWRKKIKRLILRISFEIYTDKIGIYSRAPWLRKCGNLPIRGNLVNTWPYTERATVCLHHRHTNVKYLNQPVWQPKCNSSFYLEGNHMATRTFRKKKQQQSLAFSALFFMFTLTWITEKELGRVIENKGDEHGNSKRRWENEKC